MSDHDCSRFLMTILNEIMRLSPSYLLIDQPNSMRKKKRKRNRIRVKFPTVLQLNLGYKSSHSSRNYTKYIFFFYFSSLPFKSSFCCI